MLLQYFPICSSVGSIHPFWLPAADAEQKRCPRDDLGHCCLSEMRTVPWSSWPHGLSSIPRLASFAGVGIPRKREIEIYSLNWAETKKNNHVNNMYSERETDLLTLTLQFQKQR